jgi:hypothetical protein
MRARTRPLRAYKVYVTETKAYTVAVEAANQVEARLRALQSVERHPDRDHEFGAEVTARQVAYLERAED